jgi:chromate transporter
MSGLIVAAPLASGSRAASGVIAPVALAGGAMSAATPFGLLPLFGVFLKVGAVLFGSGYVLIVFLHSDLVVRMRWLTERQLLDAVAVGQVTPGPVFTTATFIGYVLGGAPGAWVATVAIFLPAFVFVALSAPLIPKLRRSPAAAGALDGVNVASLALMALVTVDLARAAFVDTATIVIALVAAILLMRYRVNSAWLVIGAALLGFGMRHGVGLPSPRGAM